MKRDWPRLLFLRPGNSSSSELNVVMSAPYAELNYFSNFGLELTFESNSFKSWMVPLNPPLLHVARGTTLEHGITHNSCCWIGF